ncbi:hypothetical protein [Azotobacter vinelandii]|uniref:hypothetical protein n=1 Tax=Azotobacter vinelandii TaxID=354 RepID=UPI000773C8E3|nr:hypothetical protein [Azotobacter vinelandii]
MAEIYRFPQKSRRLHNIRVKSEQEERTRLAEWFRAIADRIEGNEVEREPLAAMIVLSSIAGDEVLHVGYKAQGVCLVQAGMAASRLSTCSYTRRGGNFFERRK